MINVGDTVKLIDKYDGYFRFEKHLTLTVTAITYYDGSYKAHLKELEEVEQYHWVNVKYLKPAQVTKTFTVT